MRCKAVSPCVPCVLVPWNAERLTYLDSGSFSSSAPPAAPPPPPCPPLLLLLPLFFLLELALLSLRTFSYISNFHYVHFISFPVYSETKSIACSLRCFSSSVISILPPCNIDFNYSCIFSLSSISCLESLTFSSFLVFLFMLPCFSF